MRKKTEARTRKQNKTSVPQPMGLTVRENQNPQSAGAKPALDSRSHRTTLGNILRRHKGLRAQS